MARDAVWGGECKSGMGCEYVHMCGHSHKDRATEWEDKGPDHRRWALFYSCGSKSVRARSGWHTSPVGGNKQLSQDGYSDGTL